MISYNRKTRQASRVIILTEAMYKYTELKGLGCYYFSLCLIIITTTYINYLPVCNFARLVWFRGGQYVTIYL